MVKTSLEIIKDEKTCEPDDEQLSMDHICIDGKEEEITSSVSTSSFRGCSCLIRGDPNGVMPFRLIKAIFR